MTEDATDPQRVIEKAVWRHGVTGEAGAVLAGRILDDLSAAGWAVVPTRTEVNETEHPAPDARSDSLGMTSELGSAIQTVLSLLVSGEYVALANMTGEQRLTAQMIERGVTSDGRTLTLPPQGLLPDLEIVEDARRANTWYAAMSLWTKEEVSLT